MFFEFTCLRDNKSKFIKEPVIETFLNTSTDKINIKSNKQEGYFYDYSTSCKKIMQ